MNIAMLSCPGPSVARTYRQREAASKPQIAAGKRLSWTGLILFAALAGFVVHAGASASSDLSPAESIQHFFDLLLRKQVEEAAEAAVFSSAEARAQFIRQWAGEAAFLRRYGIEGWDVEARSGSAEVAVEFRDPGANRTLRIDLVRFNGVWRVAPEKDFRLNRPDSRPPLKTEKLEDLVAVTSVTAGRRIKLSVVNKAPCALLFWFDVALPPSLKPDRPLPLHGILPPSEEAIALCDLRIADGPSYRYSWRYNVKRADDAGEMVPSGVLTLLPGVTFSDDPKFFVGEKYGYGLPYPAEEAYFIWQGPGGEFSHHEPGSRYAVDFSMPLGSEVAAVRDGVVIGVVQKNPDNPDENPSPKAMANEILILHADGTIGVYAHLTTDGARVSFGQKVRRGEVIGLSGNSGYSRGPHLHFDVLGYEEGQCVSQPFDFLSREGSLIPPRKGLTLSAEKDGTARIVTKETRPWRVVHRCYETYDTEIHYFAKSVEFLAANKTEELLGIELSFTNLQNVLSAHQLPRRVGLAVDGSFHNVLTLELVNPGEKSSFAYLFRRVEPPGREHVPLRVERDAADGYVVEARYFSDRIELHAENKSGRPMTGVLDFASLTNLTPKERIPKNIHLPAGASLHYLATLQILEPTKGYSFHYRIGPSDAEEKGTGGGGWEPVR